MDVLNPTAASDDSSEGERDHARRSLEMRTSLSSNKGVEVINVTPNGDLTGEAARLQKLLTAWQNSSQVRAGTMARSLSN